jgi:hypothetical protein
LSLKRTAKKLKPALSKIPSYVKPDKISRIVIEKPDLVIKDTFFCEFECLKIGLKENSNGHKTDENRLKTGDFPKSQNQKSPKSSYTSRRISRKFISVGSSGDGKSVKNDVMSEDKLNRVVTTREKFKIDKLSETNKTACRKTDENKENKSPVNNLVESFENTALKTPPTQILMPFKNTDSS